MSAFFFSFIPCVGFEKSFVCYCFVIFLCDEMNNRFLTNVKDRFNDAEYNLKCCAQ